MFQFVSKVMGSKDMSKLTQDDFSENVREALLGDPQLVTLLGGPHIFCDQPSDANYPHITALSH